MRLPTLSARASIVILMAISLVLGANSALADDRGDRRGGKFDKPGFNRHNELGGRAHHRDRTVRIDRRRERNDRRDNRFDSGSFFGGVVLGSLLSANHSGANRYTTSNYRGTLHYGGRYGGHFDRRFDLRRGTGYRYSTHYPTFGPTVFGHGRIYSSRYDGSRFDVWRGGRPSNTVVYQTVINPAPVVTTSIVTPPSVIRPSSSEPPRRLPEPTRRLLLDLEGNCFDVSRDSLGNEVRLQLDPAQCSL